jgi:hypothetical protein
MIAALEDSPRARAIVRQAFLPALPIRGGQTAVSAADVTSGDFGKDFSDSGNYTFNGGGKVGIGPTSPSTNLHVQNNTNGDSLQILADNANSVGGSGIQINRTHNARAAQIKLTLSGVAEWYAGELRNAGNASTGFHIGTGNDIATKTPVLSLLTSGNVGIGTTNPQAKLDVSGGINASGNVGLGVTSPPEKLTAATGSNLAIYMSTPGQPNGNPTIATGGTLSGNYWYKIVAVDGQGNTTAAGPESAEVSVTGSNNAVSLNWTAVPGASSYRVYRGTSSGGENLYYAVYTNSLLDIGAAGTSGTPPSTTTAYFVKLDSVSGSVLAGNVILGGAQTKQVSGGPELVSFQSQDNSRVVHASWGAVVAPGAPSLSQVSGGTMAATTYYVKITWVTPSGESLPSGEASKLVSASNLLTVTNPAGAPASAKGFNVYVSTSSGMEQLQNGSTPVAIGGTWTEPTSGLVSGSNPPTVNTAVDTNARLLIDIQGNHEWAGSGDVDQSILMGFNQVGVLGLQGDPQNGGGLNVTAWKHTTLTADVTSTMQTTFTVAGTSQFAVGNYVRVDNEIVYISGITPTHTLTVTRAQQGSTAATHSSGAYVTLSGQSEDYARVSIQTASALNGQPAILLGPGTTGADTLINRLDGGGLAITGSKVGIGTTSPASSALLDLSSTTGALLLPHMTTAQRNALTAVNGMIIYNTTTNQIEGYVSGAWTGL